MTDRAQRDQVVLGIVPGSAAELLMMNLKISKASAGLASPSIPLQHFSTELLVGFGRKPQTAMFGSDRIHEARWEICDKKACFCSPGRNLKNRSMECGSISGMPLS